MEKLECYRKGNKIAISVGVTTINNDHFFLLILFVFFKSKKYIPRNCFVVYVIITSGLLFKLIGQFFKICQIEISQGTTPFDISKTFNC